MQNIQFNLSEFRELLDKDTRNDSISLSGKSISECASVYILTHKYISDSKLSELRCICSMLATLSDNIPTYKFSYEFNEQFVLYMVIERKLKPSSAIGYITSIVGLLKWASRHNADLSSTYDHIPQIPYEPHRISLSMQEVAQLYYFDIDTLPYRKDSKANLASVRDMFVMNCIGLGLRYSDLSRINESCFHDGKLVMVQQKTGRKVVNNLNMVLYQRMFTDLLIKYPNHHAPFNGDINTYNKRLKKLCSHLHGTFDDVEVIEYKIAGQIVREEKPRWHCISSHVARRTFITNNILILGHSVVDVQHAVGHAQSSTTDKYIVAN